ncbi:MAG: hypothetical protein IT178_14620 [Acidobacteria bacterium]|nr:hypothetical protein [Acidobacteriota bacterium]
MTSVGWRIFGGALVVVVGGAFVLNDPVRRVLLLLVVSAAAILIARRVALRELLKRPVVSDDLFLQFYTAKYGGERRQVLEVRDHIARTIGVPADRICPDDDLEGLCTDAGRLAGSHDVVLGDLLLELAEEAEALDATFDADPVTVADYIAAWLSLNEREDRVQGAQRN